MVLLPSINVWALHPAAADAVKAIQAELDRANLIERGLTDNQGQDISLAKTIEDLEKESNFIDPNRTTVEYLKQRVQALTQERDVARDKAIHLTLAAYGIVPTDKAGRLMMLRGAIVVPDYAGKTATWVVVAGDNAPRSALTPEGSVVTTPKAVDKVTGKEPSGVTYLDGVTKILTKSFEPDPKGNSMSPLDLALLLIHERRHFIQYLTPGKGDKLTFNKAEVDAYLDDLGEIASQQNPLGLTIQEMDSYKNQRSALLGKYREAQRFEWLKKITGGFGDAVPAYNLPNTDEELAAIQEGADKLEDQIQREAEGLKASQEQQVRDLATELAAIATKVCLDPDGLTDEDLDSFDWDSSSPIGDFPGPSVHVDPYRWDCTERIFASLKASRSRPKIGVIQAQASKLQPSKPLPAPTRPPEAHTNVFVNLGRLARMACDNPEALNPQEMKTLLNEFPNGQGYDSIEIHDCADELLYKLLRFNANSTRFDYQWLQDEAGTLRRKYARTPSPEPRPQSEPQPEPDRAPRPTPSPPGYDHCIDPGGTCLKH
ncbi:MAG: hypothetical protein NTY77_07225 [Elusimicrobia bacterium]|nr:hypothetical protein [Elusimicrobiota bacterium]